MLEKYGINRIQVFTEKYSYSIKTILSANECARKHIFFTNGNSNDNIKKEAFGFKTKKLPPPYNDLQNFEKELCDIEKFIKYTERTDSFQNQLKEDISKIKTSTNVFVFADKTRNIYEVTPQKYNKFLKENITKTYKKTSERLEKAINLEAKEIAKNRYRYKSRMLGKNTSLH